MIKNGMENIRIEEMKRERKNISQNLFISQIKPIILHTGCLDIMWLCLMLIVSVEFDSVLHESTTDAFFFSIHMRYEVLSASGYK